MEVFDKAKWIGPAGGPARHPVMTGAFRVTGAAVRAVLHICGLGLFEAYVNGQKAGDEYLAPLCNDYGAYLQAFCYDVTAALRAGENSLCVQLGNGWYKGRFGLEGKSEHYGSRFAVIACLEWTDGDGGPHRLYTDESWRCHLGPVTASGIYDGEDQDYTLPPQEIPLEEIPLDKALLEPRTSLPVRIRRRLPVRQVLRTPSGDTVLDFGQNFAGWVEFRCALPAGARLQLDFGEVLQQGEFYNENYRTARASFTYVSDGKPRLVRPHFTYYGFRYVRVTGWPGPAAAADFQGCVLCSDAPRTGWFSCGNEKIQRLYENAWWGQLSNFIDLPTDCPQRDERLGWTGDAQVFSPTACLNMDCRRFYGKFLRDLRLAQQAAGGAVPDYIPTLGQTGGGGSVWGDAAAILPMQLYDSYADEEALARHYPLMRDWVDWVARQDEARGARYLFDFGFHFGDWLALDGVTPQSMKGGTDDGLIASAYWMHSAQLAARAAHILGKREDDARFTALAGNIRAAVLKEYFTPAGRLAADTQAAYVVCLRFGLYRERQPLLRAFRRRLALDGYAIRCGFVGAPVLCQTLAENGMQDLAYHFLFNEEFPGWLYCVNLGATTIWERWNSLLPDGTCSGTGMNSFNHYSYGSVAEFLYCHAAGLRRGAPGWRRAVFAPLPDARLGWCRAVYESAAGRWESGWRILPDGQLEVCCVVPEGCTAEMRLPGGETLALGPGAFRRVYRPARDYRCLYTAQTLLGDMVRDGRVLAILERNGLFPVLGALKSGDKEAAGWTMEKLADKFFLGLDPDALAKAAGEIAALTAPV